MMHFDAKDPYIGPAEIEKIKAAHPDLPLFLCDAGHGFNCINANAPRAGGAPAG